MDFSKYRFTKSHEWAILQDGVVVVGITKHAAELLNDIVFVKLPKVGEGTKLGKDFGEIESVKTVEGLKAPIDGEVAEVNSKVNSDTTIVSQDPFGKGWLIKIRPAAGATLDGLLTEEAYQTHIADDHH